MIGLTPFASGRDADVFVLDGGRVLRRYRHGDDVTAEAEIMAYLVENGFPAPDVYEARGADLVMERLDGPTMLAALMAGDLDVVQATGSRCRGHRGHHRRGGGR